MQRGHVVRLQLQTFPEDRLRLIKVATFQQQRVERVPPGFEMPLWLLSPQQRVRAAQTASRLPDVSKNVETPVA